MTDTEFDRRLHWTLGAVLLSAFLAGCIVAAMSGHSMPPPAPEPWQLMNIVPQTRCFPPGTLGVGFPCLDKLMDGMMST